MYCPFARNKLRCLAVMVLIGIGLLLVAILCRSALEQKNLRTRLDDYKTMAVYPNVHLHGHEMDLTYLAPERDSLPECEATCMENSQCVAVDYYPAHPDERKSAQCWRFDNVVQKNITVGAACCTLAVRATEKSAVAFIDKKWHAQTDKAMRIYPNTHVHNNELKLIYLAPEQNSLSDCQGLCVDNPQCVAVNYYPPKDKHSAQCWLFRDIEAHDVALNDTCCTLAVRDESKNLIGMLNQLSK